MDGLDVDLQSLRHYEASPTLITLVGLRLTLVGGGGDGGGGGAGGEVGVGVGVVVVGILNTFVF